MAGLREDSQATGPSGNPCLDDGGTRSWERGRGLSLPGLRRASCRGCPRLVSETLGHPQARPGSGRSPAPRRRLPAGLGVVAGGLMVSMGDDFQGEISSSVESLSFKAAHKMSSPPGCACCVLLSRRI